MKKLTGEQLLYGFALLLLALFSLYALRHWNTVEMAITHYGIDQQTLRSAALLESWTVRFGWFGWLVTILINMLQVIVAFIPGGPVEIASGVLYGWFWGTILCVIGLVLGESIVFLVVRRLGVRFVNRLFKKNVQEIRFFQNENKIEAITFLLFLIPGTPKDVLTYAVGLSKMPMPTFLGLTMTARMPSCVASTLIGGAVISGDFHLAFWAVIATTFVCLFGMLVKDPVIAWFDVKRKQKT